MVGQRRTPAVTYPIDMIILTTLRGSRPHRAAGRPPLKNVVHRTRQGREATETHVRHGPAAAGTDFVSFLRRERRYPVTLRAGLIPTRTADGRAALSC